MKRYFLALLILLLLGACGKKERTAPEEKPRRIKATVLEVKPQPAAKVRIFSGTVRARNQVSLSSKISGYVKEVFVEEGNIVKEGDLLLRLDDAHILAQRKAIIEARQAVAREKEAVAAKLRYAEANYRRFKNLFKEKAATKEELDRTEAEYKALLAKEKALLAKEKELFARLREIDSLLPYTRIKAPVKGLVTRRLADRGAFVNAGTPLIVLDDLEAGFEFRVRLDEAFLKKIKVDEVFQVEFPALGLTQKAPVREVVSHVDPSSRTFLIKLALEGENFRSGLYGRLYLPVSEEKMLLIPWKAVVLRGELTGVMVVEKDGRARFRVVRLGRSYQKNGNYFVPVKTPLKREEAQERNLWAEVLAGLEAGEKIVFSPLNLVRDGDQII